MVIAGGVDIEQDPNLKVEFCDLTDGEFQCTEQESSLFAYEAPALLYKIENDHEKILYDKCNI